MKSIIFSAESVNATFANRKSATRRVIPERILDKYYEYDEYCNMVMPTDIPCEREYEKEFFMGRSPYQPGETIYVKETIADLRPANLFTQGGNQIIYKATNPQYQGLVDSLKEKTGKGWTSARYMPAAAARLFILIKSVRPELLQDITGEQCVKEGYARTLDELGDDLCNYCPLPDESKGVRGTPNGYSSCEGSRCPDAYERYLEEGAIDEFADKWDELNKKRGYPWGSNPWVWVYEYERTEKVIWLEGSWRVA